MNVKRILTGLASIVLAAGLAGGLAACGSTPSRPSAVATAAAPPTASTPTPKPTVTKTVVPASTPQIIINNNNNNNPAPAAPAPTQTVVVVPAAPAVTSDSCPVGYVCMYTVAGWQNQQPEHKYFDYGYYNLSSETGPSWTPTGFVDTIRTGTMVYEERTGSGTGSQEVHPGI